MFKMSKEERNCAFEGGGRGHRNGKEMEGGRRVFQTEATTVCYMLLTTTHQTVDTDDDLREALLSLTRSGSRATEAGNQLAGCLLSTSDSSWAPEGFTSLSALSREALKGS